MACTVYVRYTYFSNLNVFLHIIQKNITKWHWTSVTIKNNIHLFTAQWIKKELFYDSMQHLTLSMKQTLYSSFKDTLKIFINGWI